MAKFKDNTGREWEIKLNGYVVREIRREFGVDLPKIYTDPDTSRRAFDRFDDLLLFLTAEQRERDDVDERSFLEQMGGAATEAAENALEEELEQFFPPRRREPIRQLKAASQKAQDEAVAKVAETIANM